MVPTRRKTDAEVLSFCVRVGEAGAPPLAAVLGEGARIAIAVHRASRVDERLLLVVREHDEFEAGVFLTCFAMLVDACVALFALFGFFFGDAAVPFFQPVEFWAFWLLLGAR